VVDQSGIPLPAHRVAARLSDINLPDMPSSVMTDASGTFRLTNCLDGAEYILNVHEQIDPNPPIGTLTAVKGGKADVVIVCSPRSAFIQGRVVDVQGDPPPSALIYWRMERGSTERLSWTDPQTGRFRLGPFPAGRFALRVEVKGRPPVRLDWHHLVTGETWDVGTIAMNTGATIIATLRMPDGGPIADAQLWVKGPDGRRYEMVLMDGLFRSVPVPSGRAVLNASGNDFAFLSTSVDTVDGQTLMVDLTAHPGVPCTLIFLDHYVHKVRAAAYVTTLSGDVVHKKPIMLQLGDSTDDQVKLRVLPGDYRVLVYAGSRSYDVPLAGLGNREGPIEIALRDD
jgi:hypothetical protein